ncbi:DUF2344 domain-containing protein [Caloramator sp. E03]|uniref:TIGR03936 family radical SAM-associated protein n=1 Tax=Caloramator sp. E03 TaxID=2576307 RepID=UPI001110DD2E|nr:TIGR03936 family radical SAM-associated protein [Caloramator sp. E03]QCX32482.1 DUF2344 domain-containing protein [Caloramator sp. E03]
MERYLIKFSKKDSVKYISHLDTMRTLHRAIRRAQLPISYSKGFNPHPSISIAAPLSLGIASCGEYADVEFESIIDEERVKNLLNSSLPDGIRIIDSLHIQGKMPSSMALVEGARYTVQLKFKGKAEEIKRSINNILASQNIERVKKTKSGEKIENIRPLIKDIVLTGYEEETFNFEFLLFTGSRGNLAPNAVIELMQEELNNDLTCEGITRDELYCIKNNKWIDLLSYFKGK